MQAVPAASMLSAARCVPIQRCHHHGMWCTAFIFILPQPPYYWQSADLNLPVETSCPACLHVGAPCCAQPNRQHSLCQSALASCAAWLIVYGCVEQRLLYDVLDCCVLIIDVRVCVDVPSASGAPQNHWFGPAGDPRGAGIGTPEAIQLVWSCHREIIHDFGPCPSSNQLKTT